MAKTTPAPITSSTLTEMAASLTVEHPEDHIRAAAAQHLSAAATFLKMAEDNDRANLEAAELAKASADTPEKTDEEPAP